MFTGTKRSLGYETYLLPGALLGYLGYFRLPHYQKAAL